MRLAEGTQIPVYLQAPIGPGPLLPSPSLLCLPGHSTHQDLSPVLPHHPCGEEEIPASASVVCWAGALGLAKVAVAMWGVLSELGPAGIVFVPGLSAVAQGGTVTQSYAGEDTKSWCWRPWSRRHTDA